MGRPKRITLGGYFYHVLNCANGRLRIFKKEADFAAFEQILSEGIERFAMRVCGYCLMGNHWHLLLWPRRDGDLSAFMRWITLTHRPAFSRRPRYHRHRAFIPGPLQKFSGAGQRPLPDRDAVHRGQSHSGTDCSGRGGLAMVQLCTPAGTAIGAESVPGTGRAAGRLDTMGSRRHRRKIAPDPAKQHQPKLPPRRAGMDA